MHVNPGARTISIHGTILLMLVACGLTSAPTLAESVTCGPGEKLDVITYDWKLKGFLAIFAGLKFPTHGTGKLRTLSKPSGIAEIELRIVSDDGDGDLYGYSSVIDLAENRTIESVDGYKFEGRTKTDTTTFNYETGKTRRVRFDTKKDIDGEVRFGDFEGTNVKDVLTAIHHICESSGDIDQPQRQGVFAGGKVYEVLITPGEIRNFVFGGRLARARLFTITATPENKKKWPGDVKVWVTQDDARLPIEIDLGKSMASLRLQASDRAKCP